MKRRVSVFGLVLFFLLVYGTGTDLLARLPSRVSASSSMWQQYTYNGPVGSRPYFVFTPENYRVGTAVPLIVMLHGCSQTAVDFAAGTQMNLLADRYNFIVLYPQQTSAYNQSLCWNWFKTSDQFRGHGEPAIIAGIVQTIEQDTSQWTIDTNRVYVAGISAGAAMATILGATYPDLFAAIGIHSGIEYQAASSAINGFKVMRRGGPDPLQQGYAAYEAMGSGARIISTIVFQGTSDVVINPVNGDRAVLQWMQTDHLASNGTYNADFNSPSSTLTERVPNGRVYTVSRWNDDNGSVLQEYWRIFGMGHAWSGGSASSSYTDPTGPSASMAMYQFFMSHSMSVHGMHEVVSRLNLRELRARLLKSLKRLRPISHDFHL